LNYRAKATVSDAKIWKFVDWTKISGEINRDEGQGTRDKGRGTRDEGGGQGESVTRR